MLATNAILNAGTAAQQASLLPDLIPAATPEVVKKVQWLFPHFVTPEGKLSVSIHFLIVDTPGAKLVVDTCIGNGRNRDPIAIVSNLSTSYLEDMIYCMRTRIALFCMSRRGGVMLNGA